MFHRVSGCIWIIAEKLRNVSEGFMGVSRSLMCFPGGKFLRIQRNEAPQLTELQSKELHRLREIFFQEISKVSSEDLLAPGINLRITKSSLGPNLRNPFIFDFLAILQQFF